MASIRNRDVTMTDHWHNFGIKDWKTARRDAFVDINEYLKRCTDLSEVFFNRLKQAKSVTFLRLPITISLRKILYQPKLYLFCNYFGGNTKFKPVLFKIYHSRLKEIDNIDLSLFSYVEEQYIDNRRKYERSEVINMFIELKDDMFQIDKTFNKHNGFSAIMSCRIMTQLRRVLLDPIEMDIVRKHHCFCFYWTNEEVKTHDASRISKYCLLNYYKKEVSV